MTHSPDYFSRYLDTTGDGSGTKTAITDYSSGVQEFKLVPAHNETFKIARLMVHIRDAGAFSSDNYGGLGSALTNGIEVKVKDGSGTKLDLTAGIPVQANADWGAHCYDISYTQFGSGSNFVQVRWTFLRAGEHLCVAGGKGEYFSVDVNDNFTGLVAHTFMAQGIKIE